MLDAEVTLQSECYDQVMRTGQLASRRTATPPLSPAPEPVVRQPDPRPPPQPEPVAVQPTPVPAMPHTDQVAKAPTFFPEPIRPKCFTVRAPLVARLRARAL